MDKIEITSWEDLQKNVKKIAVLLNKDENLLLAAASNPFFALEEMGFTYNEDIKDSLEDKLRFKTNKAEKLARLRKSIFKIAGRKFDIRNKNELNSVLFDELKIVAFKENGCPLLQTLSATAPKGTPDNLVEYTGLHPIIDPLIEFREIDRTVPGFCDKVSYDNIRKGNNAVKSRIKLRIRFKK